MENEEAIIGGLTCYQISFKPKRLQDLAFWGTMWIEKEHFKLYKIKAEIGTSSNLNFINKIAVQQQMFQGSADKAWIPAKTRVLVEIAQISSNSSGFLAKYYNSNTSFRYNINHSSEFYKDKIVLGDSVLKLSDSFWEENRPDSLTTSEKKVYHLIHTVKNIPTVKTYLTLADILLTGYYRAGKISLGPYLQGYNHNNVEGNRFSLGFKTNSSFSKRLIYGGYVAYGTLDQGVKYGANIEYILSRKTWTEGGISFIHDINQVSLLSDSYLYQRNLLFSAFARNGDVESRKSFDQDIITIYLSRLLFKGFTQKVTFSRWSLDPHFLFSYNVPNSGLINTLTISEIIFESRWSPGENAILSETSNKPLRIKRSISTPVITFRYTLGLDNVFGSDLAFHKFSINIREILKMGVLGRGKYSFTAGYIPSTVPFPLLENHLGNETPLYNPNAFNQMRFFEFASDRYASLTYTQHFGGFF